MTKKIVFNFFQKRLFYNITKNGSILLAICIICFIYLVLAFKLDFLDPQTKITLNFLNSNTVISQSNKLDKISNNRVKKLININNEKVLNIKQIVNLIDLKRNNTDRKYITNNDFLNIHEQSDDEYLEIWQLFQNRISRYGLYSEADDDEIIRPLLWRLATSSIEDIVDMADQGTQIKFIFILQNSMKALFKPKRVPRSEEESMDKYYMYEIERHTGEIASYHLDRLLHFYCVPPVSGRIVDMVSELQIFLSRSLKKKFFYSPVNNFCFFGKCTYFCDAGHAICGNRTQLEGSMAAYVPGRSYRTQFKNPWGRSYSKYNKTTWETSENGTAYCNYIKSIPPYNSQTHLLNLIDMHIFDFLIGNKDRHHYHVFSNFGNISNFLLLDNGKGFGRYSNDIVDILAPLYQCCLIRFTTLKRLLFFNNESNSENWLSNLMRMALSKDILEDILIDAHLKSLDRRIKIIIKEIEKCLNYISHESVIIDDRFYFNRY